MNERWRAVNAGLNCGPGLGAMRRLPPIDSSCDARVLNDDQITPIEVMGREVIPAIADA